MTTHITTPLNEGVVRSLKIGDPILLSGIIITGRDAVHKWMVDNFIWKTRQPTQIDMHVYQAILPILKDGIIYHCGPVVGGLNTKDYRFISAGPTTSIREEPYQAEVMEHFHVKGVIGKGGMGAKTLSACQKEPGVYLHAIGGAASLIAGSVLKVLDVFKMEFGVPEAMWVIEVKDFPAVITMDSYGNSLHTTIRELSKRNLAKILE